ncbi:hypothetical protein JNUCC1_00195 [Lentibacillus sp. JNUCC-1]|uniref:metallophosphoesterase n=1 Tax=Lentibacillus sp. JNUCC-1 TaxID=2654513 RepID=UPI0012E8C934|nr:metallophosphoesterase [Lentibacillus sp. JNUCC-1]MUV36393.1 hypothetical protein [Lentibacillus sp. JNUCC-1]
MNNKLKYCTGFFASCLIGCGIKIFHDTFLFKVNQISFKTNKWTNGTKMRVVQLSDLHNRTFGKKNNRLLKAIKDQNPDVVVITGDLIDRKTRGFRNVYQLIDVLTVMCKHVYFVSGNHEWEHPATQIFIQGLKSRGVMILDGEYAKLGKEGNSLRLIGAGYAVENAEEYDSYDLCYSTDDFNLVLAHMPDGLDISETSVDLMLCGHTHGGQIRFPLIGAMVAPGQGLFPHRAKGIYPLENGGYMYIDSGLGTTHIPVRFMNQSQFTVIDLEGCD